MTDQLCAWIIENDGRVLELPWGIEWRGWRPLGTLETSHRASQSVASDRWTHDISPRPCDEPPRTMAVGVDEDFL